MKRLYLILVLNFMLQELILSQHIPVYSQYMMNGLSINPAYAGSRDVLSATFLYREQWVGFEGAPTIFSMGAHMPFKNQKVAIGLLVLNETIGIENNTSLFGNYSYRILLGSGKLAFGFKAGFNLAKEESNKISLHDPLSDNAFENSKESSFMPNFGFGVYYSNLKYFMGVSLPTILTYSNTKVVQSDFKSYNILLTGGYLFKLSDKFKIKPSSLVKYEYKSPMQIDLNLNFILFRNDILWIGASYRNADALVSLIELQVSRKFRLGYSYDYSTGPFRNYNSGSHEIMIRYEWRDKINTISPLYF